MQFLGNIVYLDLKKKPKLESERSKEELIEFFQHKFLEFLQKANNMTK